MNYPFSNNTCPTDIRPIYSVATYVWLTPFDAYLDAEVIVKRFANGTACQFGLEIKRNTSDRSGRFIFLYRLGPVACGTAFSTRTNLADEKSQK